MVSHIVSAYASTSGNDTVIYIGSGEVCIICEIKKELGIETKPDGMQAAVCTICGGIILAQPPFMNLHVKFHEKRGEHPTDSLLEMFEWMEKDE